MSSNNTSNQNSNKKKETAQLDCFELLEFLTW